MTAVFVPLRADYSEAHCKGQDTDLFTDFETYRQARRICFTCPCKEDCYFEAVKDDLYGCWGGMWHGRPGYAGARVSGKGDVRRVRYYRAVLAERMNISLETFLARYGQGVEGIRRALQS